MAVIRVEVDCLIFVVFDYVLLEVYADDLFRNLPVLSRFRLVVLRKFKLFNPKKVSDELSGSTVAIKLVDVRQFLIIQEGVFLQKAISVSFILDNMSEPCHANPTSFSGRSS